MIFNYEAPPFRIFYRTTLADTCKSPLNAPRLVSLTRLIANTRALSAGMFSVIRLLLHFIRIKPVNTSKNRLMPRITGLLRVVIALFDVVRPRYKQLCLFITGYIIGMNNGIFC